MSEATVRCPKCGHDGIVITELLNSDLRLIADDQSQKLAALREAVLQVIDDAYDDIDCNMNPTGDMIVDGLELKKLQALAQSEVGDELG